MRNEIPSEWRRKDARVHIRRATMALSNVRLDVSSGSVRTAISAAISALEVVFRLLGPKHVEPSEDLTVVGKPTYAELAS